MATKTMDKADKSEKPVSSAKVRKRVKTQLVPPGALPLLLTVDQAMVYMGVGRNTIYSLIAREELASIKLGRHFRRIPKSACDRWVEQASGGAA